MIIKPYYDKNKEITSKDVKEIVNDNGYRMYVKIEDDNYTCRIEDRDKTILESKKSINLVQAISESIIALREKIYA